jgi:hypothetical protein
MVLYFGVTELLEPGFKSQVNFIAALMSRNASCGVHEVVSVTVSPSLFFSSVERLTFLRPENILHAEGCRKPTIERP